MPPFETSPFRLSSVMRARRLVAIAAIFLCTAVAWGLLGASMVQRTGEQDYTLRREVEGLWGTAQSQRALMVNEVTSVRETQDVAVPDAGYNSSTGHTRRTEGGRVTRRETVTREVMVSKSLLSSDVDVELSLEHRKKGLLWYPTYVVDFAAAYAFRNDERTPRTYEFGFVFPSTDAVYDAFALEVNGEAVRGDVDLAKGLTTRRVVEPGETVTLNVRYRSRGMETWTYRLGEGVSEVRSFSLDMNTNFVGVDFGAGSLSPVGRQTTARGESLAWTFDSLVTGKAIALTLPQKLNPGPLVSRIIFFAPVSLLFFFTILVILGLVRRENLHPMNYFFMAVAFFSFHLLLAYLVDHISVHEAFAVSAATSVFLVVSYLRLVAGNAVAFAQAGLAQLIFLVMFSYSFFFAGKSGLAAAVGAVVTLFVLMQVTARVDWADLFDATSRQGPSKNGSVVRVPSSLSDATSVDHSL